MKEFLALFALFITIGSATMAEDKPITTSLQQDKNNTTIAKEYLAGEFAARNNDFETAAIRFEEALAKTPDDHLLLQNTYKFMLLAGNYDKAIKYAEKYLQYDTHAVGALILLATKAASTGDFAKASTVLDSVLHDTNKKPATEIDQLIIPFIRMWIIAGEGNYDVALNMLDPRDSRSVVSGTFIALQKALLLSLSGNTEEATKTFSLLTDKSVVMPYNLAKSAASFYESIGQWDEAGRVYAQYRAQHPAMPHFENAQADVAGKTTHGLYIKDPRSGLAEVMKETARLMFSNQLYNEGLLYLQLASILRPTDHEITMLLANYNEERTNLEKAIELYNTIGKDSDFYIISQVNKAESLYKIDKKQDAKKILLDLAEKIKVKYIPLVTLADILRRDNQFKEAAKIYTKVLENIDKKNNASWAIFFARGMCYDKIGDWKKTESDMIAALELNPNQPEVVNYLAYSWIEHNQNLEKARDMLLKAAASRPDDPQILDSAGWALYKLKDYNNSVIFLEKATELMPQDATINDHLGDAYWMNGRHYEAKYQWQRAIKYGVADSSTPAELKHKIEKGLNK